MPSNNGPNLACIAIILTIMMIMVPLYIPCVKRLDFLKK